MLKAVDTARTTGRSAVLLAALLLPLLAVAPDALAVEYRLRVVSVHEQSFAALLRRGEFTYGASGPGLDRFEASLDRGAFPRGAILYDRPVHAVSAEMARAYGGVPVQPHAVDDANGGLWHEVRWEGRPGEQTVWKVSPSGLRWGELDRVALKGRGPLRQFLPFTSVNGRRGEVLSAPLDFLSAPQTREAAWPTYLSGVLELSEGIAAVIGVNASRSFPDHVYLILRQAQEPTTYKAILGWRPRERSHLNDLEAPGLDQLR